MDAAIVDDGIVSNTAGFGEAGLFKRERVGHVVEDAGRDADVAGHGSVHSVAKSLAGGVEIVEPATAHGIILVDDGGGFGNNAITFLPTDHVRAEFDDISSELVPKDDRVVYRPGLVPGPLVQVAAAYSHVGDFEEDFIGGDGGTFDFAEFDRSGFGGIIDDGWRVHDGVIRSRRRPVGGSHCR